MNLFVNAISQRGTLIIFWDDRNIIHQQEIEIQGNESSLFITHLDSFLKEKNISYSDINNIVCVNGPWSFTGVRTIVLAINAINYIIKKHITALSYFDLFPYDFVIKNSSKRDSFVKNNTSPDIQVIPNPELEEYIKQNSISQIYWENPAEIFEKYKIIEKIDYKSIIQNVKLESYDQIEPLYMKKPNIF